MLVKLRRKISAERDRKVTYYMKKKIIAMMLCMTTMLTLAGCGDKKGSTDSTEEVLSETESTEVGTYTGKRSGEFDINVNDYVTLCDYSKIDVTITGDYAVEDSDVSDYIDQMFTYYGPFYEADDSKNTVEEGDIVNVNYVGKLNGEAFDGGTAEDQNIDVTNNCAAGGQTSFIEGFTAGLMGASVGDTVDCDVTFPEDYQEASLAGQAVVFTFTVNSIQKEITVDDMTDDFVAANFGPESVDAMNQEVTSYLQSSAEYTKNNDTFEAIQNWLIENCTVEVPEDYLEARVGEYQANFVAQNCSDGTSLEDYLSTYYGYTVDQAIEKWTEYMTNNIKLEFILQAVAEKEKIEINEDEYKTYVTNLISNSQNSQNGQSFADEAALYDFYGNGHADEGEAYLRKIYTSNLALENLKEKTTVTEAPAEDTEAVNDTEMAE